MRQNHKKVPKQFLDEEGCSTEIMLGLILLDFVESDSDNN